MQIDKNKFVSVTYDLYVGGEDGSKVELMESATKKHPLNFTFGLGMMIDKFEENLKGLSEGDKFDFTIQPKDAYGDYIQEYVQEIDRSVFLNEEGEFDEENIKEGRIIKMMSEDGGQYDGMVMEVTDKFVRMDFNHPLAGETLNFKGEVLLVRDATEEEIAVATKPHHCGGGCNGCEGGCDEGGHCGHHEGGECGHHGKDGHCEHHGKDGHGHCGGHGHCH